MKKLFDNARIKFKYLSNGKELNVESGLKYSDSNISMQIITAPCNNGFRLDLKITPTVKIETLSLELIIDYNFLTDDKIFANGYQSWTDSREFNQNESIRKPGIFARMVKKKYALEGYGDGPFYKVSGKKGVLHSHTYTYIRNGDAYKFLGSLSEKSGFTIIESDVQAGKIRIIKDCEGAIWNEERVPFRIFIITGNESFVFDEYFAASGVKALQKKPVTGWTSWYNYYQNITENIILENLGAVKKYAPEFSVFQIDDGFQCFVGDWLDIDEKKFPKGMKFIADEIHNKNLKAGIWLAPFAAEKNSKIFNQKPEWILKDKNGEPVRGGANWSSFYSLDFYNPQVREYLRDVFNTVFNIWGYDLVKLDFLYAVSIIPQHGKSRGQVMCEAMEFLRECAGDKLILGCGVPLGAAFGLVDYCRIGCDVSLDWNDKYYMRFLLRERISTLNSIVNAISRRHLDGRAFLNDPDVFLLREDNLKLTDYQKETLFIINSIFGSLVFTSDNFNLYHEKQMEILNKLSGFTRKQNIDVKVRDHQLFEIKYLQNNTEHHLIVNLNSKQAKVNNITIRPYQTKFI